MPTTIVVVTDEILESFTKPALDLQTGQLVELAPEPEPEQLALDLQDNTP